MFIVNIFFYFDVLLVFDGEDLDCCGIYRSDFNCIMRLRIRGNDLFYGFFGVCCLNFFCFEVFFDLNCNFS